MSKAEFQRIKSQYMFYRAEAQKYKKVDRAVESMDAMMNTFEVLSHSSRVRELKQ